MTDNTPQIRYPEYTEKWNKYKLGEISEKVTSKNNNLIYNETFTNSAEYGVVSQKDFFNKNISNTKNLDGYYIIQDKDFVYNPRISKLAPVGPIRCNKLGRTGIISPLYTVFRTYNVDIEYLEQYFKSSKWHKFMYSNGNSGVRSDRFSIKDKVLFEMTIPLPSLPEQQQIGQLFQKLDQLITAQQEKIQHQKQTKQALLQQMFPTGDSSMPSVRYPGYDDEWSECKLNNILTLLKDGTHETHKDSSEGCLLLSAKNIKNGKIFWNKTDRIISIEDYNKIHKNFKLQQGDVLLTIVGSIGETAILKNPENITFQRSVAYLRPDKSKLTAEYLNIVIQTRQFQNELDKRKAISAQPGIYLKDLRKIRVKIPSLPEQQQIGQFFQKIDQQIQYNTTKLEHIKQMKKALLQRMFI
ncbi:MAG: restriction endonuclease subunit S [Methanosphaera sp.]|uniref:restriction endonuclease subunit S n=1 Tax=Methanosphaera sp. TaxID=2666342 RepID=UPI0025D752DF|nr:restriction endonuclease subunit S [Methanosphaera sp.]MCI5867502.1 restriction endonuclease subunit S [Methanosphaera sp.]